MQRGHVVFQDRRKTQDHKNDGDESKRQLFRGLSPEFCWSHHVAPGSYVRMNPDPCRSELSLRRFKASPETDAAQKRSYVQLPTFSAKSLLREFAKAVGLMISASTDA
jgi:hypothetical protein